MTVACRCAYNCDQRQDAWRLKNKNGGPSEQHVRLEDSEQRKGERKHSFPDEAPRDKHDQTAKLSMNTMSDERKKRTRSMGPLIPEPRYRVGPKGVSSGLSVRDLPRPSLDSIRRICEHYEAKCSGKYSSLASRYVFQMGNEIKAVVDALDRQGGDACCGCDSRRLDSSSEMWDEERDVSNSGVSAHRPPLFGERRRQEEDFASFCQHSPYAAPRCANEREVHNLKQRILELERIITDMREAAKEAGYQSQREIKENADAFRKSAEADRSRYQKLYREMQEAYETDLQTARDEVREVKRDAQLVIDFVRRRTKGSEAPQAVCNGNFEDDGSKSTTVSVAEERIKKDFSEQMHRLERKVKAAIDDEKAAVEEVCRRLNEHRAIGAAR